MEQSRTGWVCFVAGAILGVVVMLAINNRYAITGSQPIVKLDRLAGTTWILDGQGWREVP